MTGTSFNEELAWAAGLLSGMGTLIVTNDRVQLVVTSRLRPEAIERLSLISGANATTGPTPETKKMTLSGEPLHRFMKKIWPYITKERKQEYAQARKKAKGDA